MSPAALLLAVATLCHEPNDRYTACVHYADNGEVTQIVVKPKRIDILQTLSTTEYADLRARFEKLRSLGTRTELPFPFYFSSEGLLFDDEHWQYGTVEKAMSVKEEIVQFTINYCSSADR